MRGIGADAHHNDANKKGDQRRQHEIVDRAREIGGEHRDEVHRPHAGRERNRRSCNGDAPAKALRERLDGLIEHAAELQVLDDMREAARRNPDQPGYARFLNMIDEAITNAKSGGPNSGCASRAPSPCLRAKLACASATP